VDLRANKKLGPKAENSSAAIFIKENYGPELFRRLRTLKIFLK
jgi:hypothetical protein